MRPRGVKPAPRGAVAPGAIAQEGHRRLLPCPSLMSSAIDAQSLLTPPSLPWVTPRPNPHLLAGSCSYSLADGEVPPLLDALTKNSSLKRLNLAFAGLDWSGPDAVPERSGAPLVEAMHSDPCCLAELKKLIIGKAPKVPAYIVPVARLRSGEEEALKALKEGKAFLTPGGPRRVEILLMSDLIRKDRRTTAVKAKDVEASAGAVSGAGHHSAACDCSHPTRLHRRYHSLLLLCYRCYHRCH